VTGFALPKRSIRHWRACANGGECRRRGCGLY
jgi:hypothetical protein